jgi:lysozyme
VNKKAGFGLAAIMLAAPMTAYYEGTMLKTYRDPVGIPTACIGETDSEIVMQQKFTEQECLAVLGASMAVHAQEVAKCVTVPIKTHEAAALVSWSYNVGTSAACKSTLVRKLNAGDEWCSELKRWDKAGGKVLKGLTSRRESEYQMCTAGRWKV